MSKQVAAPGGRRPAPDSVTWSGSENFIAVMLLATIIFLLTDSTPIGIAIAVGGGLAIARALAMRNGARRSRSR